jgi:DNA mismatch repair protein MutL
MADLIHLLPDQVANQIAAGEVILRPGSAVKELLENAVDAGATEVDLIVKDAGRTLIQVVDNGCGMSDRDARMCFERHATSKIQHAEDLFAIRTLGFRGEALASIAAVSQVELRSRRVEDELGTLIRLEGSRVIGQEPCSLPHGSAVMVKNLFFNVPARRKFLKTDAAELKHIQDEFFRVVLVYHNIRFRYFLDGKALYNLPAQNRKQRIISLLGTQYNERLVPVEQSTETIQISGFIGKPEFARKTRGEQFFFVNGRFIKHPYLNHALEGAFTELIPKDAVPSYFIYIEVDPQTIDINIHPTKTEVNFLDHKVVYAILKSTVRKALGIYNLTPSIDFDQEQSLDFSTGDGQSIKNPFDRPPTTFNPFERKDLSQGFGRQNKKSHANWESLLDLSDTDLKGPNQGGAAGPGNNEDLAAGVKSNFFQLANQYIVTSIKSGLVVIDQQCAHERILYEDMLGKLEKQMPSSQQDLFPQQVAFSLSDAALLDELSEELNILGFRLNKLGVNTFVVTGTPSGQKDMDVQRMLEEMLDLYKKNLAGFDLDTRINLARSLASSLCLKRGKRLFPEEMEHLIDELFSCQAPEYAPDGSRTFIIVTTEQIKNQFK